ncbi:MAG TPA: hypothetical protein GX005_09915 [Bacteroidales bacterium]|nr:hypothetical protein [Bacteroidales bacterium]
MKKKYIHAAFVAVSVSIAVALSACGDDSSSDFLSPESSADTELSSSDTQDLSSSSAEVDESSSSAKAPGESSSSVKVLDAVEISCDGHSKPVWSYMNEEIDYGCIQDPRDNQVYRTVKMGERVWMAENLNYDVPLPKDKVDDPMFKWVSKRHCTNNDSCFLTCDSRENYCIRYVAETFARYYTWAAAMDSINQGGCGMGTRCNVSGQHRGACPSGWHIPSIEEFDELYEAAGGIDNAAYRLKSSNSWVCWNRECNGSDEFGFAIIPSDPYSIPDSRFWSTTEDTDSTIVVSLAYYDNDYMENFDNWSTQKFNLHQFRCLKDYEAGDVPPSSSSVDDENQCEAMVKTDITTWHFTKNDYFGDPVEYQYSINADGQIELTTSGANITGGTKTEVLYQKSTEAYMEMAYSAAKATCQD